MTFKILVATDGSDPGTHAVNYATDLAIEKNADLTVVSVAHIPPIPTSEYMAPLYYPEFTADLFQWTKKMVSVLVDNISKKHPTLNVEGIVKEGSPARGILDAVSEVNPDLIVLGNRGHGGIIGWMLGSVSRTIVDACTTSVLVVKDHKYCK